MKNILVTGGTGFIGSHTCISLLEKGYNITIVDSLINSSKSVIEGIKNVLKLSNNFEKSNINFYMGDVRNISFLGDVFLDSKNKKNPINGVIHFAGLKAVGESMLNPLIYWDVNVNGTINLLKIMDKNNCRTILFSSSATVYGDSKNIPFKESAIVNPHNTYGHTKATVENILRNIYESNSLVWKVGCLRYFNPIGSHPSGFIGESPNGGTLKIFSHIFAKLPLV